ncbi:MAG: hypothetical protein ACREIC_21855, partial [Limisphaerales bacterium]
MCRPFIRDSLRALFLLEWCYATTALVILWSLLISGSFAQAQETFTVLRVGSEVYSNVTVLGATSTHLTFTHYRDITSAKLDELDPVMQKHFHFDQQTAATLQRQGDWL